MWAAIREYGKRGLVLMGKMDNQMFFATKEQRKRYYKEHRLELSLFKDINILERVGTLLKKKAASPTLST